MTTPAASTGALEWAVPLSLRARDATHLRERAAALAASLRGDPATDLAEVASALAAEDGRALPARLVVPVLLGADASATAARLDAFATHGAWDAEVGAYSDGALPSPEGRVAVLLTGQGAEWAGMGRALYAAHAVFRGTVDEVRAHVRELLDVDLLEVLFPPDGVGACLKQMRYAQPALFAFELGVYRQLESWGLRPGALLGYSSAELFAAHIAGVIGLRDTCRLVAEWGRLAQDRTPRGAMLGVDASAAELAELLAGRSLEIDVAGVNAPRASVLSGTPEAVDAIAHELASAGKKVRRVAIDRAVHSRYMEPMLDELRELVAGMTLRPPRVPIASAVTGGWGAAADFTSVEHWARLVRRPVRFMDACRALFGAGFTTFVECGPHAILSALGTSCAAPGDDAERVFVSAVHRKQSEMLTLVRAGAVVDARGHPIDWRPLCDEIRGRAARPVVAVTRPVAVVRTKFGDELASLPAVARLERLHAIVAEAVVATLALAVDTVVPRDTPLHELGLDSAGAVELHGRIHAQTGVRLPTTMAFDNPTTRAIVEALGESLGVSERAERAVVSDAVRAQLASLDALDDEALARLVLALVEDTAF